MDGYLFSQSSGSRERFSVGLGSAPDQGAKIIRVIRIHVQGSPDLQARAPGQAFDRLALPVLEKVRVIIAVAPNDPQQEPVRLPADQPAPPELERLYLEVGAIHLAPVDATGHEKIKAY